MLDIDMAPYKAAFLNDLTRDAEGNLYLSDSQSSFVARIEPAHEHRVTILARGPQLDGANGLSIQPKTGRLAVVTWGTGRVLEVTKAGRGQALARPEIREARRCRLRRRRQPLLLRLRGGQGLPRGRGRQGLASSAKGSSRPRTSTSTGRRGCCSSLPSTRTRSARSPWRSDISRAIPAISPWCRVKPQWIGWSPGFSRSFPPEGGTPTDQYQVDRALGTATVFSDTFTNSNRKPARSGSETKHGEPQEDLAPGSRSGLARGGHPPGMGGLSAIGVNLRLGSRGRRSVFFSR